MPWVKFVFNHKTVAKYHTAGGEAARKVAKAKHKATKWKRKYAEAKKDNRKSALAKAGKKYLKYEARANATTPAAPPSPPCSDEEERMDGVIHSWA